ncbi:MAG TPA: cation-translocating P-type ATPase [Pseudosphingobacterium sp.]|nr:cation-translocating P-type ATPase [Pseudosphingobacterium sp.]
MWFSERQEEVLNAFNVTQQQGLSNAEATLRQTKFGLNELQTKKGKTISQLFFAQLQDWLIYILFVAVLITLFTGEYIDAIIILLIILLNATLGVFQEVKATNAIEELQKISTPKAVVKREGITKELDVKELVPGDIIILEAGRYVPADIRLLEAIDLQIEESALTGESIPCVKDASVLSNDTHVPLGDRHNMAYMSTLVRAGRGTGVVVSTGMETEIGKIANLISDEKEEKTPLELRLDHLGKMIGKIAISICLLIFLIAIIQGRDLMDMFLLSVSLAVASIPEGLVAIVAIVLSLGVTSMSKRNAIIRKLSAVETLGSVNIICSDKTGTFTQNRMKVSKYYLPDDKNDDPRLLAKAMILCSDATVSNEQATGDPTEIALLQWGDELQINRALLYADNQRRAELPFDSNRKLMSTLTEENNIYTVYTKGALDELMERCSHVLVNGEIIKLSKQNEEHYRQIAEEMSDQSMRVLGAAYKNVNSDTIAASEMEKDLTLLGFVGMNDPLRKEVIISAQKAKNAGIITIMITGDHKKTAFSIAQELQITTAIEQVITGREVDNMNEKEFGEKVGSYRVFARVSPEHKVKIVNALKALGNVVSMTGDGVNDAPSLKAADIGVAMGITGTDVAKSAADMILTDDNYATIITAIEHGRNIYNNIKKSIIFLLTCNFGEVVTLVVSLSLGWEAPLMATQLLWINLITDSLPAITLGMGPPQPAIMKEKPRSLHENFFAGGAGRRVVFGGMLIGLTTLLAFCYGFNRNGESPFSETVDNGTLKHAQTMAFMVLVGSQLFYALAVKSEKNHFFKVSLFSNKYLLYAITVGFALQIMVMITPFMREAFNLQVLQLRDWTTVLLLSLIPLLLIELIKALKSATKK